MRAGWFPYLAVLAVATGAQAAPEVESMEPRGLKPGASTRVLLRGKGLTEVQQVWLGCPGRVLVSEEESGGEGGRELIARVELPAGLPPGPQALRVVSLGGVSGLVRFLVDDLETWKESEPAEAAKAAGLVRLPGAVEGAVEPLGTRYYRVKLQAGQMLSAEVVAQRLGSKLDPWLRVRDPLGREVAASDDDPGAGLDARVRFRAACDGLHLLEVRDSGYEGGNDHWYRLRLGDFPLVKAGYPLLVAPGRSDPVEVTVAGCEEPVRASPQFLPGGRRWAAGLRLVEGGGSGWIAGEVAGAADRTELEPNDAVDAATPVPVPGRMSARMQSAGDVDVYRLEAEAGERVLIQGRSRSLGSPCDLRLELRDQAGKILARSRAGAADEGVITNQFAEAGHYFLNVSELNGFGGAALVYQVAIERVRAGFELSFEPDRVHAPPGGSFELTVKANRRDYGGKIDLKVEAAGSSLALENGTIDSKKDTVKLRAIVPATVEPGTMLELEVVGEASVEEEPIRVRASSNAEPADDYKETLILGVTKP